MPPRTMSKGKAVKAKKVSGKPKRGTAKKVPAKLTYGDMRRFLGKIEVWWKRLEGDVKALEELIEKLPANKPLPAEVIRELRKLEKKMEREARCAFPHVEHIPA